VLPETQLAGDTTDLSAFDCPLKLIATQDVGGRDQDLLQSVIIDDHESAELVIQAFTEAVAGREGLQTIVDQGTPYMAQATQEALEALGAEHTPQVESTPTDKATIERAFGTVKGIARPLLALSNRLAQKIKALRQPKLAIALATLLMAALLKAYQAGARAQKRAHVERQGLRREDLLAVAQEHREKSRAEDRSKRLLLEFIHDAYDIKRPKMRFVRSLRRFPLEVLKRAELAFGTQVHRDDIRDRASYFFKLVRLAQVDFLTEVARQKRQQEQRAYYRALIDEDAQQRLRWHESPARWLSDALEALASHWCPETGELLYGGVGLGRRWLIASINLLCSRHGKRAAQDIALGVFQRFTIAFADRLGLDGLREIRCLLIQQLARLPDDPDDGDGQTRCLRDFGAAILSPVGSEQRPTPVGALSNLAARPVGS
jgi:hypothetical protein